MIQQALNVMPAYALALSGRRPFLPSHDEARIIPQDCAINLAVTTRALTSR